MKRRLLCLVWAAALTALTGCALAQPVRGEAGADRWVGYYMVYQSREDGGFWFSYPVYRTPAGAFYLEADVAPCS